MPAILWPDGRVQRAPTWAALLGAVGSLPWNAHLDADKLLHVLARRAWVWSGTDVDVWGSARTVFAELERAGMLRVLRGEKGRRTAELLEEDGP